jgi:formyltetrahydrofolate deformylase
MTDTTARLLINCPDAPGIVSAVSSFLFSHGANITDLDQHATAPIGGTYFMRLELQTVAMDISREALEAAFEQEVASRFQMNWQLTYAADRKRVAILVSKHDHAMMELLWRWSRGSLPCDIVAVISNHSDLREAVEGFGVPFHLVPVTAETKALAEATLEEKLVGVDLIVLARYMQILSADFTARWPYQQAYDKGVKLIGATAHYVTADLDQGPIIEQDVERVSHRDEVGSLREMGQDVERQVLARAVRWHLEDRVLVHGTKTIVFS